MEGGVLRCYVRECLDIFFNGWFLCPLGIRCHLPHSAVSWLARIWPQVSPQSPEAEVEVRCGLYAN